MYKGVGASMWGVGIPPPPHIWSVIEDILTYIYTSPRESHAPENWLDSSFYTFTSFREGFYILPCNSILFGSHSAKKEKSIQPKQILKAQVLPFQLANVHSLC